MVLMKRCLRRPVGLLVLALLHGCGAEASRRGSPSSVPAASTPESTSGSTRGQLANEDGYDLWLRYPRVGDAALLAEYRSALQSIVVGQGAATLNLATLNLAAQELERGLTGLLGSAPARSGSVSAQGSIVLATQGSPLVAGVARALAPLGNDGYLVQATQVDGRPAILIAAQREVGVLYGAFALLRHLQTQGSLAQLSLQSAPRIQRRILNHWDNLDRTVERGYAGSSLWDWDALPATLSPRYRDYARANAAIGINGTVLTNVNANAQVLTPAYLAKVRAIADELRPYGMTTYLTARFSAPIEIGGLKSADPTLPEVQQWWRAKVDEIYRLIPDFGGFVVKANSEGQPGPQDYQRTHAQGANVLADALAPHGGIVMWRAFVYSSESPVDRIRQAYDEFQPLDGQFRANVMVQVKNGPLDFQPREPFSPLLGAMPRTPLALELQITKEYLGQDTHLAYLGPMYQEVLQADTRVAGPGSTVAKVIDGSLQRQKLTAIAGVANVGSDRNWTGSQFNQANWYVFGRMAWDPDLGAQPIAEEWVRQTFSNDASVVEPVTRMLMGSREALVSYMTPLGLAHQMATGHHYGPGPWVSDLKRPEWNPAYYHKADATGIGFDRTASGSNAVAQYAPQVASTFASRQTIPLEHLLFFHHVGWKEKLSTGRTLWQELVHRYSTGVEQARALGTTWQNVQGKVDPQRFEEVAGFLKIQADEARWWRDASLAYFGSIAGLPVPEGYEPPAKSLSFYQGLSCPADRTRPRCPEVYSP